MPQCVNYVLDDLNDVLWRGGRGEFLLITECPVRSQSVHLLISVHGVNLVFTVRAPLWPPVLSWGQSVWAWWCCRCRRQSDSCFHSV